MSFYDFLPRLLNMSLTASVVIVFVLLLRLFLKKAPKVLSYALWSMVLFRLLCPVSIQSNLSLFGLLEIPTTASGSITSTIEYVPDDLVHTPYPSVALSVPGVGEVINEALPQGEEQLVADPLEAPVAAATYVWMAGVLVMGIYAAGSYVKLRRKLVTASRLRENIYLADEITSPFVLGLFHPKIYLPSSLGEQEQTYIVLHEQHHIRRLDHIIKVLAFFALCIHWFNPLVWLAFFLSGKDMEMSCDEAVIRKLGDGVLADYAASLLSLATGRPIIAGVPLAFGEGDPKGRIRNLAHWKQPVLWGVLAAVLACAVFAVVLLTNPLHRQTVLMGADYDVEEVLYRIDFSNEEPAAVPLQYCVTADDQLYVKMEEGSDWEFLGKLEPYPLTKEELLSYTAGEKIEGYRLKEITDAYLLRAEDQNFYLVMQTESGDTLLAYGWEDVNERGEGPSDDTALRRLYLLKSSFHEGYVDVNFFERSLQSAAGGNVYVFASFESSKIPGYHITGFKSGESTDHNEMTDMGFAVFQTTGEGYRLIDCKVYEDAVLSAENGVFFCPDPAVADTGGEMRNDNTFDVLLACGEQVGKIERVYHTEGEEDRTISELCPGVHAMVLFSWADGEDCTSVSQYVYDEEGNLLSEDTLARPSASWTGWETEEQPEVVKWLDYYRSDSMPWDGSQEIELDAFPGVTFRWTPERVEAVMGEEILPLYTGMPVWNVYFTDLTGDGLPELCSTLSFGSGIVDDRVIIYDYANGASYSLEDRMAYDYSLSLEENQLVVTKRAFPIDGREGEVVETGILSYVDGCLTLLPAEK